MDVNIKEGDAFKPFDLIIRVESPDELMCLYHIFNRTAAQIDNSIVDARLFRPKVYNNLSGLFTAIHQMAVKFKCRYKSDLE